MSVDFTAIDFETANPARASVCQVGLAKVRDGRVIDTHGWTIQPPGEHNWFSSFNTGLHGIGPDDVRTAPTWATSLTEITNFIGGDVVVAHNVAFDLSVLRCACIADGLRWPTMDFLCTLQIARREFDLPSYRLPFVLEACGATLLNHHDATADAWAAATVASAMTTRAGAASVYEYAQLTRTRLGHMESGIYTAPRWVRPPNHGLIAPECNPVADPDGPLFGKVVVFTGALASMRRQDAWEQVAQAGGTPESGVTRRTGVLVAGDLNPATFAPGASTTAKVRKAFTAQDTGQDIEVMTEGDFLRALAPGGTTGGDQFDLNQLLADDTTDPTPDDSPFYEALTHSGGRANGGEPCMACGLPIDRSAAWQWRDRHVCSSRCNGAIKRWYKRWLAKGSPAAGWLVGQRLPPAL